MTFFPQYLSGRTDHHVAVANEEERERRRKFVQRSLGRPWRLGAFSRDYPKIQGI